MNKKLLQVSVDTLSGINWYEIILNRMGASRLVSVMEQTANRGPFDKFTWKKFIARVVSNLDRLSLLLVQMDFVPYKYLGFFDIWYRNFSRN